MHVSAQEIRFAFRQLLRYMPKAVFLLVIFSFLSSPAFTSGACPITLLSATGDASSIVITFQNVGKLPIRELDFNCIPSQQHAHQDQHASCREENALFFPGMEYTVSYPYPGGLPGRVTVSLKSATLSNGYVWKASQHPPCGTLKIVSRKK